MNKDMSGIETVFLISNPEWHAVNSTIVREIKKNNGDISKFVTKPELLVIA